MGAGALTPRAAVAQEVHVLTVIGLGGDPDYREAFLEWGLRIRTAVLERFGLPQENVTLLSEAPEMDPAVTGRSDREGVESAVAEVSRRAGPGDRVLVVLIGHGSYRAGEARFNLPEPAGALVIGVVHDLPASKAGVPPGSVIVALDNQPVRSPSELTRLVTSGPVGRPMTLQYIMPGGEQRKAEVSLQSLEVPLERALVGPEE